MGRSTASATSSIGRTEEHDPCHTRSDRAARPNADFPTSVSYDATQAPQNPWAVGNTPLCGPLSAFRREWITREWLRAGQPTAGIAFALLIYEAWIMLSEYLIPYLTSNAIAVAILVLACTRPRLARILLVAIFVWAAVTNSRIALSNPTVYVEYGDLALLSWYRDFIHGWFSRHIELFVLPIAAGQLAVAILLVGPRSWRRLGVAGAVVFLLAIAPLGVGSAFPFSFTLSAALIAMHLKLADAMLSGIRPADRIRTAGQR